METYLVLAIDHDLQPMVERFSLDTGLYGLLKVIEKSERIKEVKMIIKL